MRLSNTELSKENEIDGILPILQKCLLQPILASRMILRLKKCGLL